MTYAASANFAAFALLMQPVRKSLLCCLCLLHAVTLPLFQIKKIKPLIRRNKNNLHKITNVP
jgi:hypothetical protein